MRRIAVGIHIFFKQRVWRKICGMFCSCVWLEVPITSWSALLIWSKVYSKPYLKIQSWVVYILQLNKPCGAPKKKNIQLLDSKLMMARLVEILHMRFLFCFLVCFLQALFDGGHRLPDSLQAHIRWPVKEPGWRHGKIVTTLRIILLQNKRENRFALSRRFGGL